MTINSVLSWTVTGILLTGIAMAQEAKPAHQVSAWVQKSNQNAKVMLDLTAKYNPESAQQSGVDGIDDQILDLKEKRRERFTADLKAAKAELETRLTKEKDPLVRQDLEIMIRAANDNLRGIELDEKYEIPYYNMNRTLFFGMRSLLDDQVAPERRKAALVRLRKYTGMEPGYTPITKLAEDRINERINLPGRIGPYKGEVENDLSQADFFINGIGNLFKKYNIAGYEEPYAKLKQQLAEYNDFVRAKILPKARTDFRLPEEEYAFSLQQYGVDIPPAQLIQVAHASFNDFQQQMKELAPKIAAQHGWKLTDYRDVIRELKKDQWQGDTILPNYQKRIGEIEVIIEREKLVTLPTRPMRMRVATEAEAASTPAPNMRPPRLLGNTGESGEMVLPLGLPPKDPAKAAEKFDDFTYAAASWTLLAHEGRPGHELQFDAMVERGISTARALYAFNSTNVEGWGCIFRENPTALHAAGRPDDLAAIPACPCGACISRPGATGREDHTRAGAQSPNGRCLSVGFLCHQRSAALYVPLARTGHFVFLRLHQAAGIASGHGEIARQEI